MNPEMGTSYTTYTIELLYRNTSVHGVDGLA